MYIDNLLLEDRERVMTSQQKSPFLRALDRRRFIQVSAGSLAFAATGCRRQKDQAYSRGSTVIVAVPELPSYDNWLVFLPLVALNETGEWEGRLAERWEHSPDYREWTYYLRPGVRWHDGVPVTAHDVKFSLELLTHPDILEISPGDIESITVINDQTVTVRQRHTTNYAVDQVHYPKHLLGSLDPKQFYDWDFWNKPVGNGPYRCVRKVPQTMMEFEANPHHYLGRAKIERVVLKFVGWGRTGFPDILAGNVDARTFVNFEWVPTLAADVRFHIYYWYGMTGGGAIYWQHRHPLFRDSRVRRALTLAIDRRELLQVLNLPKDAPLTDGPYTARQLRRRELAEPLPHDLAQARELLEEAGWHYRNGAAVREREGLTFRFTGLISSDPNFYPTAIHVQAQLRRLGVEMVLRMDEDVGGRIRRGEFQEAAFHHFPNSTLFTLIRNNSLGYRNAKVLDVVQHALSTADPNVEDRLYGELREIFREDMPVTYLFPTTAFLLAHRRIRGLRSPYRADLLRYMGELWLEDQNG